jgi:hypothetical protein
MTDTVVPQAAVSCLRWSILISSLGVEDVMAQCSSPPQHSLVASVRPVVPCVILTEDNIRMPTISTSWYGKLRHIHHVLSHFVSQLSLPKRVLILIDAAEIQPIPSARTVLTLMNWMKYGCLHPQNLHTLILFFKVSLANYAKHSILELNVASKVNKICLLDSEEMKQNQV